MDYSKLMEWSPPLSGYAALSGGVNAFGLGGMGAARRGGLGSGGGSGGANSSVYIPPTLGFNTTSFPIRPRISDPGGLALATGDAGITPEALFDLFSTARSAPVTTYYVGAGGSDSNDGLSTGAKKASFSGCITAGNATAQPYKIICDGAGMEYTRLLGPQGTVPTQDLYITTASGRAITGQFEASSVFTPFALDGTFTNCYSITLANADRVCNRLVQSAYGWNTDHTLYASATALNGATLTSDGYVIDTGKLYIRRLDGQKPTYANTRLYRSSGTNLFRFTTAVNVFVENIDAEGGLNGCWDYTMSAQQSVTKVFVAKSCTGRYGGGQVNTLARGFNISGMKGLAYLYGCDASANATDGISARDTVSSGQQMLTVNCSGSDNGRVSPNASCNGLTLHDTCVGIDLAGNFPANRGGSVRFIAGKMLCAGTYSTDLGDSSLGGSTVPTCFYADAGGEMWCDRTKAGLDSSGSNKAYVAVTGATIHKRNARTAGATDGGGGGTIDSY